METQELSLPRRSDQAENASRCLRELRSANSEVNKAQPWHPLMDSSETFL